MKINWVLVLYVSVVLGALGVCSLSLLFFFLKAIDLVWLLAVWIIMFVGTAGLLLIMPKFKELMSMASIVGPPEGQDGILSEDLIYECEIARDSTQQLEVLPNVGGMWDILREQLKKKYPWDTTKLKAYTPINMRPFPRREHTFFAAEITPDITGGVRSVVAVLDLKIYKVEGRKVMRVFWHGIREITEFEDFEKWVEQGRYDREKVKASALQVQNPEVSFRI
jgi:predicted membrane channel-forming protein YqfA (hemolysin III family)